MPPEDDSTNRMAEEMREYRLSLRPLDAERAAEYLAAEKRRLSVPLVAYKDAGTQAEAFAFQRPEEEPAPAPASAPPAYRFAHVVYSYYYARAAASDPSADTAWTNAAASADGQTPQTHQHFSVTGDEGFGVTWQNLGAHLADGTIDASQSATDDYSTTRYTAYAKAVPSWLFQLASSTGYLKIFWDETIYKSENDFTAGDSGNGYPLTTVSTNARSYELDNHGVSFPSAASEYDYSQYLSPPDNVVMTSSLKPPTPTDFTQANDSVRTATSSYSFMIENVRWTAIRNYVPPVDGSANGFPT